MDAAASQPGASQMGNGLPSTSTEPVRAPPSRQKVAPSTPNSLPGAKWLLGIGAVIGAIWLLSSASNQKPLSGPSAVANAPSVPQSPTAESTRYTPPSTSVPLGEEMPPPGTNMVLSYPQLRYCSSESIRLDAAKLAVSGHNEFGVGRFNSMVADYNSRCGQFRYRKGSLESVRTEVEANRSSLEAQGVARFQSQTNSSAVQLDPLHQYVPDPAPGQFGSDPPRAAQQRAPSVAANRREKPIFKCWTAENGTFFQDYPCSGASPASPNEILRNVPTFGGR
jgi:hypothetical protein